MARISARKCVPPVRSPGRYGPTASMTLAITGSTRRRCARARRARAGCVTTLVTLEYLRGAVAVERDDVIAVFAAAQVHAGRPGRHSTHRDAGDLRLLLQEPLNIGRGDVPFDDVPVHERGVTRVQVFGYPITARGRGDRRRVLGDPGEGVLT